MTASIGSTSTSVFHQTLSGLHQDSATLRAQETLIGLSNHPSAASQSVMTSGDSNKMMEQLTSEKQSADSAEELIQEVYQRFKTAIGVDDKQASQHWKELESHLKNSQSELKEFQNEAQGSASSRKIYNLVSKALDEAVSSLELANKQGPERGRRSLTRSEGHLLSAISQLSDFADNLERSSLNVFRVQKAYAFAPGQAAAARNWEANLAIAQAQTGSVLDLVS